MDSLTLYAVLAGIVMLFYGWRKYLTHGIAQYSPGEVKDRIKAGSILLDVRTSAERKQSSIAGSLHIPLHELGAKLKTLDRYRSHEVIVYCASGSRSLSAATQLKRQGFAVGNLKGGIGAWKFAQL